MELSIYAQIVNCCHDSQNELLSRQDIIHAVHNKYGTNPSSVIPSDYCYNRTNKGAADKPLFEWLGNGQYRYLGEGFAYTGRVFSRPLGAKQDIVVAMWENGVQTPFTEKSL
ncbi:DUF7225 domain-containing protein [Vitreoscilla stercoraria]|uniref:DUF7225 domain-containing protein n=1 Tax=Vitreoscilla stercoraria TaxID=61 RepID=A0ABY4EB54_VITST|nr:hypothetical protein [Vitreoscilla stercoraria]UOO92526.1 hypothetical protein LVJ81_00260 [Vitreoscilla stercoraria]